MVKPAAFKPHKSNRRCLICKNPSMSSWLSESLRLTVDSGEKRPSAAFVHGELRQAFPEIAPAHENSTRRHLFDHDDVWREWVEKG